MTARALSYAHGATAFHHCSDRRVRGPRGAQATLKGPQPGATRSEPPDQQRGQRGEVA